MIHVIAAIELTEGKRDEFLQQFRQLVPKVRAEEGCLEYGPTIDVTTGIDAQDPIRDNVVTVVEKWASIDALKRHLEAPHVQEYRETVQDWVVGMQLHILEPV